MTIIQSGVVEMYLYCDRTKKLPIDFLIRGSILNHNLFLAKRTVHVEVECISPVYLKLKSYKIHSVRKMNPRGGLY